MTSKKAEVLYFALALGACSGASDQTVADQNNVGTGTAGAAGLVNTIAGTSGAPPTASGGSMNGAGAAAPVAGATASGGATSSTPGEGLPCDVSAVVKKNCATCHGASPQFGAQFSMTRVADFAASPSGSTKSIGQRVLERIEDEQRPMPPPPNARLSAADIATLQNWVHSGYQGAACAEPADSGMTGSGGAGFGGASSGGASSGGGATGTPSDLECYDLVARASASGEKYTVPTTPDLYQCFNYKAPWGNKQVQVVSASPIIDNAKVLHHWILYNSPDAVRDGSNNSCVGAHPSAAFITGWAPGGDGLRMPADVGLRTEGGSFTLETHYNNSSGAGQLDSSGARVCVTEQLRPKEAAVHWLGTQNLNKLRASGTCSPSNSGPVTILSMSPHMHLQGRHMTTVINRKGGATEMLLDKPFDFQTQISYPTQTVINPGDTLTTTCTFATPTPFGQGTNQEMCYNFVVAYPAGQLAHPFSLLRKYDCTN